MRLLTILLATMLSSYLFTGCTQSEAVVSDAPQLISTWEQSSEEFNSVYLNLYKYNDEFYFVFMHRELMGWEIEVIPLDEWNPHSDGDIEYEGIVETPTGEGWA